MVSRSPPRSVAWAWIVGTALAAPAASKESQSVSPTIDEAVGLIDSEKLDETSTLLEATLELVRLEQFASGYETSVKHVAIDIEWAATPLRSSGPWSRTRSNSL